MGLISGGRLPSGRHQLSDVEVREGAKRGSEEEEGDKREGEEVRTRLAAMWTELKHARESRTRSMGHLLRLVSELAQQVLLVDRVHAQVSLVERLLRMHATLCARVTALRAACPTLPAPVLSLLASSSFLPGQASSSSPPPPLQRSCSPLELSEQAFRSLDALLLPVSFHLLLALPLPLPLPLLHPFTFLHIHTQVSICIDSGLLNPPSAYLQRSARKNFYSGRGGESRSTRGGLIRGSPRRGVLGPRVPGDRVHKFSQGINGNYNF